MLHKEYGVGYGAIDRNSFPLVNDTRGLTKIPHGTQGMVKVWDKIEVSLPIKMRMQ